MPPSAIQESPGDSVDPATLWHLAMQAHTRRDYATSRGFGLRLLRLEPQSARAHWLLASLELEDGNMNAALSHVRALSALGRNLPSSQLVAVTRLMITVGEFATAWHLLRDALQASPSADLLVAIGEQMLMLERYPDALACLLAAERQGFRHPMLSFLLSSTYRFLGDLPCAIAAAEDTLQLQPNFAHAHWALSQLGCRDNAGQRIDRVRQSIRALERRSDVSSPQIQSGLSMLWHALFREMDTLEDRAAAWTCLEAGLAIKRRLQPHDQNAENRLFLHLRRTYTDAFVQPLGGLVEAEVTPIFIIGLPRTGTTLVERVITNHQQVAGCGELNELQLQVKRCTGHWSPAFVDETSAARLADADLRGLGDAYLSAVAWRLDGKRFMVDKHQSNFLLAGVIARCIPNARMIHVRRDSVDACFSNLKEPFAAHAYAYSNDLRDVANHFRNYDGLMKQLQQAAGDRILELRYEDLVLDRKRQSDRILRFTGLSPQDGLEDTSANSSPVASASSVQVREPIHDRYVGAWRRYAGELGILVDALGELA